MRTLALALAVLATPALAQSSPEAPAPPDRVAADSVAVDSVLVGDWTLDTVVEPGVLDDYGVKIQTMTCMFSATGVGRVAMTAIQDGAPMERERDFTFVAAEGEITEDDGKTVRYRMTEAGALELIDDNLVVRFVRVGA